MKHLVLLLSAACLSTGIARAEEPSTVAVARKMILDGDIKGADTLVIAEIARARRSRDTTLLADLLQLRAEQLSGTDQAAGEAALREAMALRAARAAASGEPQDAYRLGEDTAMLGMLRNMQNDPEGGLAAVRAGVADMARGARTREQRTEAAGAWVSLGDMEAAAGNVAAANAVMARAVAALDALGDTPSYPTAVARTNLADYMIRIGDGAQALALSRRALAERAAIQPADHPEIVDAIGVAGDAEMRFGSVDEAERLFRRAVAIVDRKPEVMPAQASRAYQNLGRLYFRLDRADLALPLYRQGAARMLATQVERASQLRADASAAADAAGEREAAVREIDAAVEIARGPGATKSTLGANLLERAGFAVAAGEVDRAARDVAEAKALYAASLRADSPRHGDALILQAMIDDAKSDRPAARAHCGSGLTAMAVRPSSSPTLIAARARCATIYARAGDVRGGYGLARKAADAQTVLIVAQTARPAAGPPTDRAGVFDAALDSGWVIAAAR